MAYARERERERDRVIRNIFVRVESIRIFSLSIIEEGEMMITTHRWPFKSLSLST